jgi:hypothetical protein
MTPQIRPQLLLSKSIQIHCSLNMLLYDDVKSVTNGSKNIYVVEFINNTWCGAEQQTLTVSNFKRKNMFKIKIYNRLFRNYYLQQTDYTVV